MIHGVGVDLVSIPRIVGLLQRQGDALLDSVLTAAERQACRASPAPGRFLARCIAAKEAFGKALGRGLRAPVSLQLIELVDSADDQTALVFHGPLAHHIQQQGLQFHLSLCTGEARVVASVIARSH